MGRRAMPCMPIARVVTADGIWQVLHDARRPQVSRGGAVVAAAAAAAAYALLPPSSDDPSSFGLIQRSAGALLETMRKVYPEVRARVSFLEIYNEVLEDLLIPAEASAAAAGGGGGSGGGFMSPPASARSSGGHGSSSAVMHRLQSGAGAVGVLEPHIVSFEAAKDTLDALAATARGIRPGTGGCVRAWTGEACGCTTPLPLAADPSTTSSAA